MDQIRPMRPHRALPNMSAPHWWPDELGDAASSGSSGELRYAYFARACRLLIERQGRLTTYDTGEHQFRGALQAQGAERKLSFISQHGSVTLDSLKIISP
jgi:hypothetical protein